MFNSDLGGVSVFITLAPMVKTAKMIKRHWSGILQWRIFQKKLGK
jgi:hypothetical protein